MGSWNGTCLVSNLPIFAGDPVVMFPITQYHFYKPEKADRAGYCYAYEAWELLGLPFEGAYNDYGFIEGVTNPDMMNLTFDYIRGCLIEKELGENQYHDHEVKKDKLDLGTFGTWTHGGRLQVKNEMGHYKDCLDNTCVSYFMVHKRVFDLLAAESYWMYSFNKATVAADIAPLFMQYFEAHKTEVPIEKMVDTWKLDEKVRLYVRDYRGSKDILENTPPALWQQVADLYAKVAIFDISVSVLRLLYTPTSGAGSQSQNYALQRKLMQVRTEIMDANQIDEDEEEDEDDIEAEPPSS
jgi:hypothetical protein